MKFRYLAAMGLISSWLMTGCVAIDAARLMYGNEYAAHAWHSDTRTTTLPFEVLNEHIIVAVSVNGARDLRMVLDTGAAATVIFETDKTRPLLSQLDSQFTVGGIGDGGRTDAYFIHDTILSLGAVTISGLSTVFIKAADNPLFANADVTYIDGVIGYDVFQRFVTDISYTHHTVRLSEHKVQATDGYQRLPLTINNNLPYVDITVRGDDAAATLPVLLDTGGVGSLLIRDADKLPRSETLYVSHASGLGGELAVSVNRLDAVRIADYTIPGVIASVSQDAGQTSKTNIMGTGLLKRFDLIIDYPSSQVLLRPNAHFHQPDPVNHFGAGFLPHRQGAFVNTLRADSPAMRMGLQEADVIVSVNGQSIDYQTFDASSQQLATLQAVREICFLRNQSRQCQQVKH